MTEKEPKEAAKKKMFYFILFYIKTQLTCLQVINLTYYIFLLDLCFILSQILIFVRFFLWGKKVLFVLYISLESLLRSFWHHLLFFFWGPTLQLAAVYAS